MGVRIDQYDYGVNCGLCFPAGLTPEFIMASFTGILPGTTYIPPVNDPSPNRIFKLTQIPATPCIWEIQDGTHWVIFKIQANNTEMRLYDNTGLIKMFEALVLPTCKVAFDSDLTDPPPRPYHEGRCQLAWVPPTGVVSLRNAVENMGIDPDDDIWVDWYPKDNNTMIVRAIRGEDNSRVLGEHDF